MNNQPQVQSFDQKFESMNKALQLSCLRGLPVRVVRSHKEKRSAYAPSEDQPVRWVVARPTVGGSGRRHQGRASWWGVCL